MKPAHSAFALAALGLGFWAGGTGALFGSDWTNAVEAGASPARSVATAIRAANAKEFYVAGTITTATSDFLLLRADATGHERWRVVYNHTNNGADLVRALGVDAAGNAYAIGRIPGEGGVTDIGILKCTAKGVQKSLTVYHDDNGDEYDLPLDPIAATVDAAGNTYVMTLRELGTSSIDQILLRFDASGRLQWIRTNAHYTTPEFARSAVVADGTKAAYVVTMSESNVLSATRYLSSGAVAWRTAHLGTLPANPTAAAAVDAAGNLHIASTDPVRSEAPAMARVDLQVDKVTRKGAVAWHKRYRAAQPAVLSADAIVVDTTGNVTVAGAAERAGPSDATQLFVLGLNKLGQERWAKWRAWWGQPKLAIALASRKGGLALSITETNNCEMLTVALDVNGVQTWEDDAGWCMQTHGVAAFSPNALAVVGDLTDSENPLPRIVVAGFNLPTNKKLSLTRIPQTQNVSPGVDAAFSVAARGTGTLQFQWYRNGLLLEGATRPNLLLPAVGPGDVGEYAVLVRDATGVVVSPSARLNLNTPPQILSQPVFREAAVGDLVWFAVGVEVNGPVRYQWQHNGFDIPGANEPNLLLRAVSLSDVGAYRLVVTSPSGVATSEAAGLELRKFGGLDTWSWIEAYPQGNPVSGIAFGAGRFVAPTWGGTVLSSRNGVNWIISAPFENESYDGVIWGSDRFLIYGRNGLGQNIARISTDGLNWQRGVIASTGYILQVGAGGGLFLAIAQDGTFLRSTNGMDWLSYNPGLNPSALGYGNGLFVAAGGLPLVHTSPDGVTWTPHNIPNALTATRVVYGGGRYVVVGKTGGIAISSNGSDWTSTAVNDPLTSVTYAQGIFVAVGLNGMSHASANSLSWFDQNVGPTGLYDVAYGNGLFVCVGAAGGIYTSPNPGLWTPQFTGGGNKKYRSVFSADDTTVVVGEEGTVLSSVGEDSFLPCSVATARDFRGVTHGPGLWIAVGDNGTIQVSANAAVWESAYSPTSEDLRAVTFGNGQYICVGDHGTVLTSIDGREWRQRNAGTNSLRAVCHANNAYVAVGEAGTLLTSSDGSTWVSQNSHLTKELTSVCFGSGLWVVSADNGDFTISANTGTWTKIESNFDEVTGLAFKDGLFVAIARRAILSSLDGRNWEEHLHGAYFELRDLAFENGHIIAVGDGQSILVSEELTGDR